ncbi:PIG-L family deacetylase [Erythrobacter sp.]|uniref:PIG-L family deacetylase n=1 Tax=Erythrobacter sp. TaxID=1042 RepID=UPI0025D38908|nr:PIG-L family deacetylase [Erythrobacter sp.]
MTRTANMIALAVLAMTPVSAQEQGNPRNVLVVLAHPDDELVIAPALAAMRRDGAQVRIAFATSGDAGPGESGMAPGAELAQVREGEARCSAAALGLGEPEFWRLGDGTLGSSARGPDSPAAQVLARIGAAIAANRPGMVITWGPDGGYGHVDHRMVSALTVQAAQAMPEAERPIMLHPAIRTGTAPAIPQLESWATTAPELVQYGLAYTPADLAAAKTAAACHVTQFDEASRAGMMPLFDATIWQGKVHFRRAF